MNLCGFHLGSERDGLRVQGEACKWDHAEGVVSVTPVLSLEKEPFLSMSSSLSHPATENTQQRWDSSVPRAPLHHPLGH